MKPIWGLRPEGFSLKERRPFLKSLVGFTPDQALFFKSTLADIDRAERAFCAKLVATACGLQHEPLVPAIISDAEILQLCEITLAETEGFEPSVPDLPVRRFSKPLVSATHPRLQRVWHRRRIASHAFGCNGY